jgi:hypothetical protein
MIKNFGGPSKCPYSVSNKLKWALVHASVFNSLTNLFSQCIVIMMVILSINGVKLVEHFNSRDAATELIDGGDISCLWTNAGWNNETLPETGPLYYSSRGEDSPPRLDANKYDYLADGEEYAYIYTLNDEWVCYNRYQFEDNRMPEVVAIPVPVAA